MSVSSLDFLSPKITLFYNGHDAHISQIGGLLSILLSMIIATLSLNYIYKLFDPNLHSVFIYDQIINNTKYYQSMDYLGINHFIQIFSHSNRDWFGDFDNKNLIIYGIKEDESTNDLYNIEHWLYDKCESVPGISKSLFSEISEIISNYSKSICLRYYYHPTDKIYYEIGHQKYISPYLETNKIDEKKYTYNIVFEKCFNDSIFTNKMNYFCNDENIIQSYLTLYNKILLFFSNNQINFKSNKYFNEKYFYSISAAFQKNSYFKNDIIFSPSKFITDRGFLHSKKENISYILKDNYDYNQKINEENAIIGVFKFVLRNSLIIYYKKYVTFIETLSHLGGIIQLLFFIFKFLNYINRHYTTLDNTKDLFKINTGIDSNLLEGNELFFDKLRHLNSQSYKIKVFNNNNNNNIINSDDLNKIKLNIHQTKKKPKYSLNDHHISIGPTAGHRQSKRNLGFIMPIPPNNSNRKKSNYNSNQRSQTKYTNTFKQMGKQYTMKNKRKSIVSQGFLLKNENSSYSKNPSFCDNNNHENTSINNINDINNINNSSFVLLKDAKDGISKYDTKNINDVSGRRKTIKKKMNLKKRNTSQNDNPEYTPKSILKKVDNRGRHKSVNFGNQRDFFFSTNLLGFKNFALGKDSSENVIKKSSKQLKNLNPKNSPMLYANKFHIDKTKTKIDEFISKPSIVNNKNNEKNLNTTILNIPKNPNNPNNPNSDMTSFLKNIIQSKLKRMLPENKQDTYFDIILEKKLNFANFLRFICTCFKNNGNKIYFLYNFRNKLLSEEHLYRVHINLFLLEKIFQIDEAYKLNTNELYNNL